MIVAGTGHRPNRLGGYSRLIRVQAVTLARRHLAIIKPTKVISGMAQGWDQALAMACHMDGLPFVAAVPCRDHESRWPEEAQHYYRGLIERASEVVFVSEHYSRRAMVKRDKWMVDQADHILALCNGMIGSGTAITVDYAASKGRPVTNLWAEWAFRDIIG